MTVTLAVLFLLTVLALTFNVWLMRDLTRYLITLVREIHTQLIRRR